MIIAILVIISSIIGLIGFFIANPIMFYVGGAISFFDMVRYWTVMTIEKDRAEIKQIRENRFYQRMKNSAIYHAKNEKELKGLIRQFIISNIIGRVITYGLGFGLLLYFFSWKAFIWIGIVGGLGYIFMIAPKILHRKKT
jgi:hypothetical protein